MKKESGLTIIQTMVVLFILGIAGWFAVDWLIDKRCAENPAQAMCADRQAPAAPAAK